MTSLRTRTQALRRQHILEAAIRVFARHGFHRATIRQIAEEAGVADGTIYNTFEDKSALLFAVLEPLGQPAPDGNALRAMVAGGDVGSLVRTLLVERWNAFTPATLDALRVVLSEVLVDDRLGRRFVRTFIAPALTGPVPLFEDLVERGLMSAVDVPILMRTLTALLLGMVTLRLVGDPVLNERWGAVPDQIVDLLLGGLLVDSKR